MYSLLICRFVVLYTLFLIIRRFYVNVFLATICWISKKEEIYNSDKSLWVKVKESYIWLRRWLKNIVPCPKDEIHRLFKILLIFFIQNHFKQQYVNIFAKPTHPMYESVLLVLYKDRRNSALCVHFKHG